MGTCSKPFKSCSTGGISFTIIIIILEWLVANLISLNLHVNIYISNCYKLFECVRCSIMDIKYNKFYSILFYSVNNYSVIAVIVVFA